MKSGLSFPPRLYSTGTVGHIFPLCVVDSKRELDKCPLMKTATATPDRCETGTMNYVRRVNGKESVPYFSINSFPALLPRQRYKNTKQIKGKYTLRS